MNRLFRAPQGSDIWFAARRKRITGSRIADVMAPPTTKASIRKGVSYPAGTEALDRIKYRQELVVERIYDRAANNYVTQAMQDGIDREPYARILYEAETMHIVEQVGFSLHPAWDWFGASVDGLAGDKGTVELKCPTEGVHDSYAADPNVMAEEYKWQCLASLICFPEREWCDLASFQPYAPDSIKLVRFRFMRSDWLATIDEIQNASQELNAKVEAEIARRGLPPTVFGIMPKEAQ